MQKGNKIRKMIIMCSLAAILFGENSMLVSATVPNNETKEGMETQKQPVATTDTTGEVPTEQEAVSASEISQNQSKEEEIAAILSQNPEDAPLPVQQEPEHINTTYSKDVSFSQVTLKGIFSSSELYFYIPEYWDTKYVFAEIQYHVSELIQDVGSSLTFSINNVPVQSCKIAYQDENVQIAYVKIPLEQIKEGYNSLSIAAYARLYDEGGCMDEESNANWLSIDDTSFIRSGYELKDTGHRISYYPYPFMSTTEETGKGLTIAVSDKATNGELAAAMNVMADLSTDTIDRNNIQFSLLKDLPSTNANRCIVVAEYDNLPKEYKEKVKGVKELDNAATITFCDDNRARPLMIITSKNTDCLLEAAYMLMDEERVSQEISDKATVHLGSADAIRSSTKPSAMAAGNYTVGDIVGGGMTFTGPFHQEQNLYLPFSEDYFLSDAGKVSLSFRYSENLDFDRSLLSVFWGDVPIASKKLSKDKATGDVLTFAMPQDVVGTTAGSLRIAFDLEVKELACSARQDKMPWAYVSEESTLFLPASTGIVLTFDLKPSPFRTDGKFNDMMLVVPDKPTTDDLNMYAQIIGMYGEGVDPYGTFYVRRVSEFSENDADYNIITVGTFENNELLQKLNSNLYFTYTDSGKQFVSNEQLILSDTYARDISIFQLLKSPFAENRGIMAVTGTNRENLSRIEKFMRDTKRRFSLSKDCVIVDSELQTKAYQFIESIDKIEEPTLIGTLAKNKQSVLFTVVATSVMLMMLIAITIMLIRIRMYHKKNNE